MKNLFLLFVLCTFLLVLLSDCKRDGNYSVRGRFLRSCENPEPLRDVEVVLYSIDETNIPIKTCKHNVRIAVKTDSEGNFEFSYKKICSRLKLGVRASAKPYSLDIVGIDIREDIVLGNVFGVDSIPISLSIKTDTAYSNQDTLYCGFRQTRTRDTFDLAIPGPFTDNQFIGKMLPRWYVYDNQAKKFNSYINFNLRNNNPYSYPSINGRFFKEPCSQNDSFKVDISKK